MPKATRDLSDQTSSRELLVDLAGVPRGRWGVALEEAIRRAVRSGRLRPGARLPSTRALAADLGVSRSVVVGAYEQLAAEGYLATHRGAPARVSDLVTRRTPPPGTTAPPGQDAPGRTADVARPPVGAGHHAALLAPAIAGGGGLGAGGLAPTGRTPGAPVPPAADAPVLADAAAPPPVDAPGGDPAPASPNGGGGWDGGVGDGGGGVVDLRPGSPTLGSLPRAEWGRAVRRALATLPDADLGYGDSRGLPRLREALADYLGRVRGAVVEPEHIVVVNGFAQGLVVVARLLAEAGIAAVGVEDPGSAHTTGHLAAQGVVPVPVPVDADGVDVDAAPPGPGGPLRALVATPAHQFPTGAVLAPARRLRLVEWAERVDGLVVEDDYDAEYRYDQHPVGALQGMAPDRVVLGGSTSKTLAPGLRLGWLAVPPAVAGDAARHKRHLDLMAPVLEQAALAELLASGAYERHIRRSRARYRRRRDLAVELLAEALPGATVRGTSAGLHLLVETPSVADEAAVVAAAARRGVATVGLGDHRHAPGPAGFVIGFGHLTEDALRRGVTGLAGAVREASPGTRGGSGPPRTGSAPSWRGGGRVRPAG